MNDYGITFNGLHSAKDMNLKVIDRKIGNPSKIKHKVPAVHSNIMHDFSSVYGGPSYTERFLSYTFEIVATDRSSLSVLEAKVLRWLMTPSGKISLTDDFVDGYYFEAEVEEQPDLERLWKYGQLVVEFTAYPLKKSILSEGHDIWDEIIFDLDVLQPVDFEVIRTDFKPVAVGSYGTLGAWAGAYDGLDKIPKEVLGVSRLIEDKRLTTQGVSKVAYKLSGIDQWVIEQDIIEAQNGITEINLINNGSTSVIPKVTANNPFSILKGNQVFNVWKGVSMSERFMLDVGDNHMELTGNYPTQVHFEFYKELI